MQRLWLQLYGGTLLGWCSTAMSLLFSRLEEPTTGTPHIKSWLLFILFSKILSQRFQGSPYTGKLHGQVAWTQLGILFGWAARTIQDNSILVTSMWTAFLLEMLSASILHNLEQVCKVCFMKRKTKEVMLTTQVWESKSATFYFTSTNCCNCWVTINNSNWITEPAW